MEGYKIKESELRMIFEDDFKSYYLKEKTKKLKTKKAKESVVYEYDHYTFQHYFYEKFKGDNYEYNIIATTLPCCSYKNCTDSIIGIEVKHVDMFSMDVVDTNAFTNLNKYNKCLKDMLYKLNLHKCCDDIPKMYFIANDCMRCT